MALPVIFDTAQQYLFEDLGKMLAAGVTRLRQSNTLSDESRDFAISIIQRCVNVVLSQGLTFSDDTISELSPYGIKFEV